jgi:mono/diheme cytochrome c family protein
MKSFWHSRFEVAVVVVGVLLLSASGGCGAPVAKFESNRAYAINQEVSLDAKLSPQRMQEVADVVAAMFGTPDQPHMPAIDGYDWGQTFSDEQELAAFEEFQVNRLAAPQNLLAAAGPVRTDEAGNPQGLYRKHCAHCHGVTGDGMGPTAAFLNPYPRDYRAGVYKFKSTPVGVRPTHSDLTKTLVEGISGTAMPSFKLLPADEVNALVEYVRYLSLRGEVERSLITYCLSELDAETRLIDVSLRSSEDPEQRALFDEQLNIIKMYTAEVLGKWWLADKQVTPIEQSPTTDDEQKSIDRGREIFYTVANCNKCHGDAALGDGQTNDYDFWTKELLPDNPEALDKMLAVGALQPRHIRPRNLRQGIYRGGRRPVDIYWRVYNGIEGTPMPGLGANVLQEGDPPDPNKLTKEDLWHLIRYVRHLPYEDISQPLYQPDFQRERN